MSILMWTCYIFNQEWVVWQFFWTVSETDVGWEDACVCHSGGEIAKERKKERKNIYIYFWDTYFNCVVSFCVCLFPDWWHYSQIGLLCCIYMVTFKKHTFRIKKMTVFKFPASYWLLLCWLPCFVTIIPPQCFFFFFFVALITPHTIQEAATSSGCTDSRGVDSQHCRLLQDKHAPLLPFFFKRDCSPSVQRHVALEREKKIPNKKKKHGRF